MTTKRRTAAEVIGMFLAWDIGDVNDMRYQPTKYPYPAIYGIDYEGGYAMMAAPAKGSMPRGYAGYKWEQIGELFERPIFGGKPL